MTNSDKSTNVHSQLAANGPLHLRAIEEHPSRTREVFEILRLAIARRDLVPGNLYSVAELAEIFHVSRTPVREALIDLASRGVVRFERNKGVRVVQSSVHDLEEIFELRLLLEVAAARTAAAQISEPELIALREHLRQLQLLGDSDADLAYWHSDRAFHRVILRTTRNNRLAEFVETLRDVTLVKGATTAGRTRMLSDITADHEQILKYVEARDPDNAAAAMRQHLQNTADVLISQESGEEPLA